MFDINQKFYKSKNKKFINKLYLIYNFKSIKVNKIAQFKIINELIA